MSTVMHEPKKNWDPGTIVPYMRQGSTSCQEYDSFSKLRNLDIDRTQHHRLFQPKHPHRTGRGGRFGRGGGQSRNKDHSDKAFEVERNKTATEALLNATIDTIEPTDYTATISPGRCARIEEPGVMDSGANVSITNPKIVAKFHLTPQRWERSFHIIFGNGGRFACTHYADFGPILGRIAIVDEAPDTLLSIAALTDRGYEVRFLPEGQGVRIYSKSQLLFQGPQHPHSKLFHIDIQSLIHPPPDYEPDLSALTIGPGKEHHDSPAKAVNRAALDLTTARDVLWLHKRMGHPSRATMYQSIT